MNKTQIHPSACVPQHPGSAGVPNGSAVAPVDGTQAEGKDVAGSVAVDYETREGSAKPGKDFRYMQGTLVSALVIWYQL